MGYVFDGEVGSARALFQKKARFEPSRPARRLFLGGLFLLLAVVDAVLVGGVTAVAAGAGEPRLLALGVLASPLPVALAWFGARLWKGRPVPGGPAFAGVLVAGFAAFAGAMLFFVVLLLGTITAAIGLP